MKILSVAQVNSLSEALLKFVWVNGEFRFVDMIENSDVRHSDLVSEGESVQGAGIISLWLDFWRLEDSYSSTLRVRCGGECLRALLSAIKRPGKTRWGEDIVVS